MHDRNEVLLFCQPLLGYLKRLQQFEQLTVRWIYKDFVLRR